jgi:hypothetical protein
MKKHLLNLFLSFHIFVVYAQTDNSKANNFMDMMQTMMEAQKNVKFESLYEFSQSVKLKMTQENKGKTEVNYMTYFTGNNCIMIKIDGEQEYSIIDSKNKSMLMIDEEEKSGSAISTAFTESIISSFSNKGNIKDSLKYKTPSITKTGQTKAIAGYKCEEYLVLDAENKFETRMWLTSDFSFNFMSVLSQFATNLHLKPPTYNNTLSGSVLAVYTKDLKTNNVDSMEVIEISKQSKNIDLSTFTIDIGM